MSGRGTVYSYVVTHQATNAAFRDKTPFATVLIELEEGPRMASNLTDVAPDAIEIGMPVEVVYKDALGRKDRDGHSYVSYFFQPA